MNTQKNTQLTHKGDYVMTCCQTTNDMYYKPIILYLASIIKCDPKFLHFVGRGSERGYISRRYYPIGFRFCSMVTHGKRKGLYKIQLTGKGGPFGNSSLYITNLYFEKN